MKITRNILLLTFILTAQTSTSFAMQNFAIKAAKMGISGTCSLVELFVTTAPLLSTTLFSTPNTQQNIESNAPQAVNDCIAQIATERHIHNPKVILKNDHHSYSADTNNGIIYIPREEALEFESLLSNTNRSSEEEKKLNEHLGTIHHELTHFTRQSKKYNPIYDAAIGTTGAVATSTILTSLTKKYIPAIHNNFALRNCFKLVRSGITFYTALNLINMHIYSKYDELKADDGIPNKKELLESQEKYYRTRHLKSLECVDFVKKQTDYTTIISEELPNDQFIRPFNRKQFIAMKTIPRICFNYPLVMDTVFHFNDTHPSDLRRAQRFENRIAKI